MKKITERTKKELSYTDELHFVEALLQDESVAKGEFNITMSEATFEGKINLNVITNEMRRYVSAKVQTAIEIQKARQVQETH